jgi:hypothetical protein
MNIFKLAILFKRLAQDAFSFKERVLNVRPQQNIPSFREAANLVLDDLKELNPGEKDAGYTKSTYELIDLLQTSNLTADKMLSAVRSAQSEIAQKAPTNQKAISNAKYLQMLANFLINKYFHPQEPKTPEEAKPDEPKPQTKPENASLFLQRIYKQLRQGQSINENDLTTWANFKSIFSRRLNGLNSLPSRSKQQEQERFVIQFVISKLTV